MEKIHRQHLKKLLQDEKFDALAKYYEMYSEKLRKQNVIGSDNGETLKLTLMREGGILAIQQFFTNLEKEIYD